MRKLVAITILFCGCCLFSCEYNSTTPEPGYLPDSGYITATIDGVESIYTAPDVLGTVYYTQEKAFNIAFYGNSSRWSIDVRGVDLQNATFPIVISGPNEIEGHPNFGCNIFSDDPTHITYGIIVAGTNSLYWNTTLTITSLEGDVIKGTFEGEGIGSDGPGIGQHAKIFSGGKFLAKLITR